MKENSSEEIRQEELTTLLWMGLSIERAGLRTAGMYGESDRFLRDLLGDDVCDYWNN